MPDSERNVFTVSQITRQIRLLLEESIGQIWVEGEISNHRMQSSGHQYFTLKDENSQISCVLFRGDTGRRFAAPLRDGLKVQVLGDLTVYEQRGNYQLIVRIVQPKGLGSLQQRFEALKQKLAAEGLFDNDHKKELPKLPHTVALVTSPTGAAIRDMLNILTRRAPWLRIMVFPVRVQGQGAEVEIARAIGQLNQAEEIGLPRPDVIVVGRGGGSLEDLWCFNEEIVARAIFASEIPIVSAVGHEIDFTISDFVADLRAPTPSAAAELLAPDRADLLRRMEAIERILSYRTRTTLEQQSRVLELMARGPLRSAPPRQVQDTEQRLDEVEDRFKLSALERCQTLDQNLAQWQRTLERFQPARVVGEAHHRLALLEHRLAGIPSRRMEEAQQKVASLSKLLRSLGPDGVLDRGFSLTLTSDGKPILDAAEAKPGQTIVTKVARGRISSIVTE